MLAYDQGDHSGGNLSGLVFEIDTRVVVSWIGLAYEFAR